MDQPTQESPGRDDDRSSGELATIGKVDARDAAVRDNQLIGLAFDHRQVSHLADSGLHRGGVKLPIGLGPRSAHGRALAPIEHPKLNARCIGDPAHQAIQGVNLPDQMALAQSADRRIAGHRADGCKAMGHQGGRCAHTRSRTGGLAAGVASSDDDDVE